MKLAQFIQMEMEQILEDWEEAALEIAPELEGIDRSALQDHARAMLEFISDDLQASQSKQESARKALGKAEGPVSVAGGKHGRGRLKQGLSMLQVVQELRALRERVIRRWGDEQQGLTTNDLDELVRFN